jgi:sterol desaturase/sphingolipid hydroxylase (fatty acid hydroxylase superfamily)
METYQEQVGGSLGGFIADMGSFIRSIFMTRFGRMITLLVLGLWLMSLVLGLLPPLVAIAQPVAWGLLVAFVVHAIWNYWGNNDIEMRFR